MKIITAIKDTDLNKCADIRKKVYGDEENAPEKLYIVDDIDKNGNTFLLLVKNIAVGTIRFMEVDKTTIEIQRLVVLPEYRNKGYATKLVQYVEQKAIKLGYKKIIMDSAFKAVGFYEKNGYKSVSEMFFSDNRPHVKMEKYL